MLVFNSFKFVIFLTLKYYLSKNIFVSYIYIIQTSWPIAVNIFVSYIFLNFNYINRHMSILHVGITNISSHAPTSNKEEEEEEKNWYCAADCLTCEKHILEIKNNNYFKTANWKFQCFRCYVPFFDFDRLTMNSNNKYYISNLQLIVFCIKVINLLCK